MALINTVTAKFDFVDSIKYSINSLVDIINNTGNAPHITITLGATKYTEKTDVQIDFSWYEPFKNYGDVIITGFAYAFFLWRLFITLPSIISGVGGAYKNIVTMPENLKGWW